MKTRFQSCQTLRFLFCCYFFIGGFWKTSAQTIDWTQAKIVLLTDNKKFLLQTPKILQEEIEKRSGIHLVLTKQKAFGDSPAILLLDENNLSGLSEKQRISLNALPPIGTEGFQIFKSEKNVIVVGKDARGLLYGVGWLLRKAEMRPGNILLKGNMALSSTPFYKLRGHQLGYRAKTNAYDAFSVQMFDQYIRDLALFGANSIEILPPRTDDQASSAHMVLPPEQMVVQQSRICKKYGLDVWMWYPNVGADYIHPDSIAHELAEREKVFASLPKLDAIFVPSADPGDLAPDVLFSWLEKEARVLRKYHPDAKIWVSPQGFDTDQKWFDHFFAQVNKHYPWFGGVVFGPWVKIPVRILRQLVNADIPIRHYPDITHSMSCQYPIPHWDLAWAQTLGRECINPRPNDEKTIHNAIEKFCIGSISYSEGTNDDLNKFIWLGQDWDPSLPAIETLRDYARLFIGPDFSESGAQGIEALETNMRGAAITNQSIDLTLLQWQRIEQQASPRIMQSARLQMCLIRAYFDAYTRRRLIYETELEQEAKDILESVKPGEADRAIQQVRDILGRAVTSPPLPAYKEKCNTLADSLFKSIGAQLTIKRHGGMQERGNFMDFIDYPLTNAPWLLDQLSMIEKTASDEEKRKEIFKIIHRNDAGPGGFYNNFGDALGWQHVVPAPIPWAQDPGNLESPHIGFAVGLAGVHWLDNPLGVGFKGKIIPTSWMNQAMTLYGVPLKIHYEGLDTGSDYRIRVAYTGRFRSHLKLMTESGYTVHDFIQTGVDPLYEFDLPKSAIRHGAVDLIWTCQETDRGSQVAEMWLMKKNQIIQ